MALVRHVALVSESKKVSLSEATKVSAALQKQVTRDFSPIWGITGTVDAYGSLEEVPTDYWPMIIRDDIGVSGASGIHLDKDGQPYALISSSEENDVWSLTASHECLEMLADPFGDNVVAGDSPHPEQGRVLFLVEVCDPSEAANYGYSVNGVLVSDFYSPHFFDPVVAAGVRYSYTNAITEPRDVLPGGYLSWKVVETEHWWQEVWFDGPKSEFVDLGPLTAANGSIRSQIDRLTEAARGKVLGRGRKVAMAAGLSRARVQSASSGKAQQLRKEIELLLSKKPAPVSNLTASGKGSGAATASRRHASRVVVEK